MTAFLDVAYYCHSCKKSYTRHDKHKCPQKCLACFKYFPDGNKCKGKDVTIIVSNVIVFSMVTAVLKTILVTDRKKMMIQYVAL